MSAEKNIKIESTWKKALEENFKSESFQKLREFIREEYRINTCFPPASQIFNAFDHCPYDEVKVVIIGQDPYHGKGQANGLCFSVAPGVRFPPSLRNIFKEIKNDLEKGIPDSGDLTRWADQGVLLINATLTVREKQPGSHQKKGWEEFTDSVIRKLNEEKEGLVYLLWGAFAQKKADFIDEKRNLVLRSAHPSPFSADRGFFGNRHFSKTNDYLLKSGKEPIDW